MKVKTFHRSHLSLSKACPKSQINSITTLQKVTNRKLPRGLFLIPLHVLLTYFSFHLDVSLCKSWTSWRELKENHNVLVKLEGFDRVFTFEPAFGVCLIHPLWLFITCYGWEICNCLCNCWIPLQEHGEGSSLHQRKAWTLRFTHFSIFSGAAQACEPGSKGSIGAKCRCW